MIVLKNLDLNHPDPQKLRAAQDALDMVPAHSPEMTELSVTEQKQLQQLENGLLIADRYINKNYLINIAQNEVVPISEKEKEKGSYAIRLFLLEKLVYDKQENVNDKLISVYSALLDVGSEALLIVSGKGDGVDVYLGVRSLSDDAIANEASIAGRILKKGFEGNFPGSILKNMRNSEIVSVMESIMDTTRQNSSKNVSCVTIVPSMRDENKDKFVQGMEKFINTMQGEVYTAVIIAKPVGKHELETRKRGFEELYSALSPHIKTSLSYGVNYSKAVNRGMSENFSHSINNSVSNTTGRNSGTNSSYTSGTSSGGSISGGGFGYNSGSSSSSTTGYSSGSSWSRAVTSGTADTTGIGVNVGVASTSGDSRTLGVEYQNKSVSVMLERIDNQLKRIRACEAFGVWECAAYFIADDIQTSVIGANAYKALMLGDGTDVENSFVNVWDIRSPYTHNILEYVRYALHPVIRTNTEEGYEAQLVSPGNFISGKELPLLMGLPQKSVSGLTVTMTPEYGRNVFLQTKRGERRKIRLGSIYHMGRTEEKPVELDLDSFTAHCFITGSTGSGKSNTTYGLIARFIENHIPFLVIEPAKGEYKEAFGALEGINIFTTNPLIGQMLKLNPFRFDPKIHILEHLDRLIEIFNACWEMYAAMPAILKDAVEQIYIDKGWDLLNSVCVSDGEPVYPNFNDLLRTLPQVIKHSGYSSDTQGDYTGALVTRVKSLTNGISGQIFCDCYDVADEVLFDQNTVIDLSRVGSSETKSLIMGILVLKLSEYRMANTSGPNSGLKHATILEEAHNLLKRVDSGSAGSSVIAKSVEMICSSIAEMRTYGEGFIIVDQSPTSVDIAAVKNTNTKILMRLPEKGDCEAVGNAVGLNEDQIREMSRLSTGVAVVMQNNWLEAVLCHVDAYSNKYEKKIAPASQESLRRLRGAVVQEIMQQYIVDRVMNEERMMTVIDNTDALPFKKNEMKACMRFTLDRLGKSRDIDFFCETLLNISGTRNLFDVAENAIISSEGKAENKYDVDSIMEWHTAFKHELSRYLELPDAFRDSLIRYLLYAQESEHHSVDYGEVYRILF